MDWPHSRFVEAVWPRARTPSAVHSGEPAEASGHRKTGRAAFAAAKADLMKKRVTALEDERNIHRMLNGQMEYKKTLKDRLKRDQEYATITKADVDRVIKKEKNL